VRARADALMERFPEARQALQFYSSLAGFEGGWPELRDLVTAGGPALLRDLAARIADDDLNEAIERYLVGDSPESPACFFARILLSRRPPSPKSVYSNRCPRCGQPPQCGCLRPHGDGSAFSLVCSLCATEWNFPRAQCPVCGEPAVFYASERMDHVQTQVCEQCSCYFHVIHLGKDPAAVPLVDEVAALALDVWALERGLRKIHPNLVGL
jgi:hypothetical protein